LVIKGAISLFIFAAVFTLEFDVIAVGDNATTVTVDCALLFVRPLIALIVSTNLYPAPTFTKLSVTTTG
ncbi:hypothetical protein OFN64_39560, partial [Escherichia coli]|nr:hypothetical protein [Escherichia coli]